MGVNRWKEHEQTRAKVAELHAEMEQLRSVMSKSQERFEHKHAELDRYAREKEQALVAAKEVCIVREKISMQLRFLLVSEWLVDVFVEAILFSYNTPHTSLHYPPNPSYPKTKYRVIGSII